LKRMIDLMWEDTTLQDFFYKKIIIPYLMFLSVLILFEAYLNVLLFSSMGLLRTLGYKPTVYFWGCSLFLIAAMVLTVMVFFDTVIAIKNKKGNLFFTAKK